MIVGGLRTGTPVKVREGPFRGALGSIVERLAAFATAPLMQIMSWEMADEGPPQIYVMFRNR